MNALQAAVALVGLVMFSAAAAGCAKSIEDLYPPASAELVKPIHQSRMAHRHRSPAS